MKKPIIILFSITAYAAGFAALLYVIGFTANILVPKSIDSGAPAAAGDPYLVDILLLMLFGLQHSIMARPSFKAWWVNVVGSAAERSIYVLCTGLVLLLLCSQWHPLPQVIWRSENHILITALKVVYFAGWLIVLLSTFMINHFELFGLKQAFEHYSGRQPAQPVFRVSYFYTFVRHPIMLGLLIAFWATPVMTLGHLIFTLFNTLYIFIAVKYLEEKDLKDTFPGKYEKYQQEVPMLIPGFNSRKRQKV